ncbi:MAG: ABC transporter ATP-binding protein [Aeriscardovia sp.]|nr:ABC transporter ATP-binding protein [Aeriscardovia sp.]
MNLESPTLESPTLESPFLKKTEDKAILSLKDVSVHAGGVRILDLRGKDIEIFPGDVVGIIGENGAGKSTLINCIVGKVHFEGQINRRFTLKDLGVQFQYNPYDTLLKVEEIVEIVCNENKGDPRLKDAIGQFELSSLLPKKVKKLSGGERQRLTLFLTLFKNPELLVVDELTSGLDFQKRQEMLYRLRTASLGKTVLAVTHYFEELRGWANKLLILQKGELVFFGTIKDLEGRYSFYSFIRFPRPIGNFEGLAHIKTVQIDMGTMGAVAKTEEEEKEILSFLSKAAIPAECGKKDIYSLYLLALSDFKGEKNL